MIAVCAPVWNRLAMTTAWVESVRRNSVGHEVKVYLVDNGSGDTGAAEGIAALADWSIRYPDNGSLQRAANVLLKRACEDDPEIICYSNNDCLVAPGWLDPILREHRKGGKRFFCAHNPLTNAATFEADYHALRPTLKPETVGATPSWCIFLPPDAVPVFWPIPEEFNLWYGDAWMHRKLAREGWSCEAVLDCIVLHYGSVSFYAHPNYKNLVDADIKLWDRLIREGA